MSAAAIDDLAGVFHLGERLFQAEKVPNLYPTWNVPKDPFRIMGRLFYFDINWRQDEGR